jgi:transcriptional regulator with XRE-family HTH domain
LLPVSLYAILKVSNWSAALSILQVSIRQIKAARALLAWSQERIAEKSGVSIPTVKRLESVDGPIGGRLETIKKIVSALQSAGVEFTTGRSPGVRLRPRDNKIASLPVADLNNQNGE